MIDIIKLKENFIFLIKIIFEPFNDIQTNVWSKKYPDIHTWQSHDICIKGQPKNSTQRHLEFLYSKKNNVYYLRALKVTNMITDVENF